MPRKYNYILLLLLPALLVFMHYRAYQMINILYIFTGVVLLITNRTMLLYLYIFLLPTNFFLPLVTNIFGFLSGREIVSLFALAAGVMELQNSRKDKTFLDRDFFDFPRSFAWYTILFLVLYIILTRIRDVITVFSPSDEGFSTFNLISYSVKIIVFYIPLYFVIRLSKDRFYRSLFVQALFVSSLLISLGVIFSYFLFDTGFLETISESRTFGAVTRHIGFFGAGGDINSLAGFLAIAMGVFLSQSSFLQLRRVFLFGGMALIILAIAYSASRAGIICLAVVLFLNLRLRNFIFMFFGFVIMLFIIPNEIIQTNYDRFSTLGRELDMSGSGSRMYILSRYLEYIFTQPGVILTGATERLRTGAFFFVPHNFYITLLYRWGIIPVILVIYMLIRFGVYVARIADRSVRLMLSSALIPLILVSNTVSDFGYLYAFFLAIALVPSQEEIDDEKDEIVEEEVYAEA